MSGRKLRLASFDSGGERGVSQLEIMGAIMYRLQCDKYPNDPDKIMLPCEHFDLIGGAGTGGLIAIMLTKLHMSVDEASEEFFTLVQEVYAPKNLAPAERTQKLRGCMEGLLKKKGLPIDLRLRGETTTGQCAGFVVASLSAGATGKVVLRTYPVRSQIPSIITVIDAALASCSAQPDFAPVSSGSGYMKKVYVAAGLGANNPVSDVITEAHELFGGDSSVAFLLSIGAGHPGTIPVPPDGNVDIHRLMRDMMNDGEQRAQEVERRLGRVGIYFRFSVQQGMQNSHGGHATDPSWISSQTDAYLSDQMTSENIDVLLQAFDAPNKHVTLGQLEYVGGSGVSKESTATLEIVLDAIGLDPDKSEESDESTEHVLGRRSIRVTLYGLKQDSETIRIWINEKSTYGDVREGLAERYDAQTITVLQAMYGPKPYWIVSDSESTIESTHLDLYAVITEPRRYSLSVVRTALFDYPIAIFDFKDGPTITISQAIIMAQPDLTDRIRSITGYAANWNGNEDQYIYEHVQELEHATFPTVFFIMVDESPGPFLTDASGESVPPFLQIQFVQCRELLRRAYNLELLPLQAIHVSRALYHLVISLAKALEGVFSEEDTIAEQLTERDNMGAVLRVAPIIAGNLQSVLYSFGGTVKALEEKLVDPEKEMVGIRRVLNDLCGDYPGAVVVRQSFETFERLVRMDREEILLSTSNENVVGTVISGTAVAGGLGKPGEGTHLVSDFDRITHHGEEASISGQSYRGTSSTDDRTGRELAKPKGVSVESSEELDALVNRAFSSLQVVAPWREASIDHPQLQQVIEQIQGHALVYCEAIDNSIKTAQDGFDFSCDAIDLCGHLLDPDTDPNDLQGYIGDIQGKAKRAHEDSVTTLNKFRHVRQGLMEITKTIPQEVLAATEKSPKGLIARLFSLGKKRDVEIEAAIKELSLAALDIVELAHTVDNFANWWNKMDVALFTAENNASFLKPGRINPLRVGSIQKGWNTIRDDYKQYSNAFRAVLTSSAAPVTLVSSWIGSGIQRLQGSLHQGQQSE